MLGSGPSQLGGPPPTATAVAGSGLQHHDEHHDERREARLKGAFAGGTARAFVETPPASPPRRGRVSSPELCLLQLRLQRGEARTLDAPPASLAVSTTQSTRNLCPGASGLHPKRSRRSCDVSVSRSTMDPEKVLAAGRIARRGEHEPERHEGIACFRGGEGRQAGVELLATQLRYHRRGFCRRRRGVGPVVRRRPWNGRVLRRRRSPRLVSVEGTRDGRGCEGLRYFDGRHPCDGRRLVVASRSCACTGAAPVLRRGRGRRRWHRRLAPLVVLPSRDWYPRPWRSRARKGAPAPAKN